MLINTDKFAGITIKRLLTTKKPTINALNNLNELIMNL